MDQLQEATDAQTSPERLAQLALDENVAVRRAVTEHPKTQPDVLFALGQVFPAALAKNPALVMLAQRQPELLQEMPAPTVRMLLTLPALPDPVWPHLVRHKDARLRTEILACPRVPPSILTMIAQERPDPNDRHCIAIAANPSAPSSLLHELSQHKDTYVRAAVAANPSTDKALLDVLAKDDHEHVRAGVAANPNATQKALEHLAKDRYFDVLTSLAGNPSISVKVMGKLVREISVYVWANLAANPSTPPSLFSALIRKDSMDVDEQIAKRPDAPAQILQRLATSPYANVHDALATNPSVPRSTLQWLPQSQRPAREPSRITEYRTIMVPANTQPMYTGRNFAVYRIDFEGQLCCLKVPVSELNYGMFQSDRVLGGMSTSWDLRCQGGSTPRHVRWVSVEEMLESEAARIRASQGTWNHEVIALVQCHIGGKVLPGLLTPWHHGDVFGTLAREKQRTLFPRMLPSFWKALSTAHHGDLHPNNIILSPDEDRFHLIDPGAMLFRNLAANGGHFGGSHMSFVTNVAHYPLLPPYDAYTSDVSLQRGDSLRGHWEHFKWSLTVSHIAPTAPTIYSNVLVREISTDIGHFPAERHRPPNEPAPSDLLALGILYFRLLTNRSPFPDLAQPAWSRISTVDDRISGIAATESQLDRGITRPKALNSAITDEEEQLVLALLDLQIPNREHLHALAYGAAKSVA